MEKKLIVVKIGSSSLTNSKGEIDQKKFTDHIQAIAKLKQVGHEVVLLFQVQLLAASENLDIRQDPLRLKVSKRLQL